MPDADQTTPPSTDDTPDLETSDETVDIDESLLERQVEAILMTLDRPTPTTKIAEAVGLSSAKPITAAITRLNELYTQTQRSFRIAQVAGGWQILTQPEYREILANLHRTKADTRLSPAALETLAIVAYRQPVLRSDIEAIRGVASGEVLRSLMDKHLVKIAGRAEEIGRPMLYGTTKRFLEVFGLASLRDLPDAKELVKP